MGPSGARAQQEWNRPMGVGLSDSAVHFTVLIEPAGPAFRASAGTSLFQSAREAGWVLPSSCRNGTFRTWMGRRVSGSAGQRVNGRVVYAVERPGWNAEEMAEGFMRPCVALPAAGVSEFLGSKRHETFRRRPTALAAYRPPRCESLSRHGAKPFVKVFSRRVAN